MGRAQGKPEAVTTVRRGLRTRSQLASADARHDVTAVALDEFRARIQRAVVQDEFRHISPRLAECYERMLAEDMPEQWAVDFMALMCVPSMHKSPSYDAARIAMREYVSSRSGQAIHDLHHAGWLNNDQVHTLREFSSRSTALHATLGAQDLLHTSQKLAALTPVSDEEAAAITRLQTHCEQRGHELLSDESSFYASGSVWDTLVTLACSEQFTNPENRARVQERYQNGHIERHRALFADAPQPPNAPVLFPDYKHVAAITKINDDDTATFVARVYGEYTSIPNVVLMSEKGYQQQFAGSAGETFSPTLVHELTHNVQNEIRPEAPVHDSGTPGQQYMKYFLCEGATELYAHTALENEGVTNIKAAAGYEPVMGVIEGIAEAAGGETRAVQNKMAFVPSEDALANVARLLYGEDSPAHQELVEKTLGELNTRMKETNSRELMREAAREAFSRSISL